MERTQQLMNVSGVRIVRQDAIKQPLVRAIIDKRQKATVAKNVSYSWSKYCGSRKIDKSS